MKPTHAVLPLLLLASQLLPAQQFVVDPANGPGTNFTNLATAIAAVPSGSTLIVRPATYPKIVIDGKGLTILGDPGALVSGSLDWYLTIKNTAASQPVYVRGLRPVSQMTAPQVLDAAGLVCIDCPNIVLVVGGGYPIYESLKISNSAQVHVRGCSISLGGATPITGSDVVFEDCDFHGRTGGWFSPTGSYPSSPALTLNASRVQFVRCSATGGLAGAGHPDQPAIVFDAASEVRLLGSGTYAGAGAAPALSGPGTVRSDPAVTVTGAPPSIFVPMPSMSCSDGSPGSFAAANCVVPTNDAFVALYGLPGPVVDVPGMPDPVWFDLQAFFGHTAAVGPYPAGFAVQLALPVTGVPIGLHFVWHTAVLRPTGIELSNPSVSVVR